MVSKEARNLDLVASFVLFRTPAEEISRAVTQVLSSPLQTHVVLVDNASSTSLPAFDPEQVTVIRPGQNIGYGSGHNRAFAATAGWAPFHAALNTDLFYGPEVLPTLVGFMRSHDDIGLAMPRICYPDGQIQHLCRLLPHPLDVFGRGFAPASPWTKRRNDRYEFRWWSYDRVAEFPFLSGCFMVLRRDAIDRVGGFDERFFMYGEDADLSRRIGQHHRTIFVPMATALHEYRSQRGGLRRFAIKVVNLARYFDKWGWWSDRERDALNERALMALRDSG